MNRSTLGLLSFNRIGYVVNSNNWAVHEEVLRNEWGFQGATVNDAWAKDFSSADLMIRAGDDTFMSGDASFTKTYLTIGEWDASLRDGKGDVLVPNEDGDDVFESTTHYFAMRKSAQRTQMAKVNSNQYKNFASDYALTATVYYGVGNAAQIQCADTSDFSITLCEGQELPTGLTASGFVVDYAQPILGQYQPGDPEYKQGWGVDNNIYGEYVPQGTYTVLVNMACDGFIEVSNVTLTINVVSPYQVNGQIIAGVDGADPVVYAKAGEEIIIDSKPFAYQAFLSTAGMGKEITNWYVVNGARYLRNEEKTHADGPTIAYETAEEKHEVTFTVEGGDGLEIEYLTGTAYGLRTNKPFTVNTGVKIVAPAAGTYNIVLVENVPWAPALAGIWLMPAMGGEETFTQAITLIVE